MGSSLSRVLAVVCGAAFFSCVQKFPDAGADESLSAILLFNLAGSRGPCNGQGFCYLFATAGAWLGDLGGNTGISGADARCMADGNKPTSGVYKALLSDGATRIATVTPNVGDGQAGWVLYASTQYRRPDGQVIMTTDSAKIFVFGALSNIIVGTGTYHTGMNSGWNAGVHCAAWTDNTNMNSTRYGTSNATGSTAISLTQTTCDAATRGLYCAQQ